MDISPNEIERLHLIAKNIKTLVSKLTADAEQAGLHPKTQWLKDAVGAVTRLMHAAPGTNLDAYLFGDQLNRLIRGRSIRTPISSDEALNTLRISRLKCLGYVAGAESNRWKKPE